MKQTDFTRENKLPAYAVLFLIILSIKRILKEFWGLAVLLLFRGRNSKSSMLHYAFLFLGIALGIAVFRGVMLYLNFRYSVVDGKLTIKKGVFKKTFLSIPLQRIQNVSITQGFWQQLFGITTLAVDTAGTADKELEIYLDKATSNALKEFLMQSRAEIVHDQYIENTETAPENVYAYSFGKLLLAAFTRNHIKGFGLGAVLLLSFLGQINRTYIEQTLSAMEQISSRYSSIYHMVFISFSAVCLVMLISIAHTCLKYYGLTVKWGGGRVHYQGGLIKRMEQIIRFDKIQLVRQTANLLEKRFGLSTLRLLQFLSVSTNPKNDIQFTLPGFWDSQLFEKEILEGLSSECFSEFYPQRNYLFRNFLRYAVYPSAVIAAGIFWDVKIAFLAVFWFLAGSLCAYLRFKKSKSEVGEEYLRISSGMMGEVVTTMKIRNVQSVSFRQSVFQQRRGTASVVIASRWDDLVIPFVKVNEAQIICNYLLYKIESECDNAQNSTQ